MRKSLFLTLVLSLCVADFGAFAAAQRRGSGTTTPTNTATQQAPVSARAGARQKVVSAPATTSSASAPVSARAGARQKVASVPTTTAKASSGTGNVAARSATKKALSMGTKVAAATENTVVSQECQNAYYGCMDAFCMLDNAAGGRCQCNDRNAELDAVLDEIMRIDEQSARIATEGVEQIQMGEYANQVNSKAKSVESGFASNGSVSTSSSKKSTSSVSTSRSLDLSSLMNNNFFDVEDDEGIFSEASESSIIEDIAGKTGDDLQKAAAKICVAQAPAQCKSSLSMLQMAYVQKIKSDCVGYENALKQQRSASQQKLLTAQKAVRDAALDEVRKQNKYETAGECAIAFAQCMQTTAECGSDYTGCVTLAAADNLKASVKGNNKSAASYTIKGVVSGADVTLAASTMEALLAKKEICVSVTKQCVNSNKNDAVWNLFLRNAAPALKSAELIAEQNLRSNCLPTVAECFKTACKSQFGENNDSYDMCLSNPATYKSLCKVQLEPCLNATGGTFEKAEESSLWNGLVAMLNSMKVDACTKEVKDCLLSEDRCGSDFSKCIGLDTYSIGRMCPAAKLTACMTAKDGEKPYYEDEDAIYAYVAKVAQGLALNIDNSFAKVCQNAVEEALIKACGDGGSGKEETSTCPNFDLNFASLKNKMHVAYYDATQTKTTDASRTRGGSTRQFYDTVEEFVAAKKLSGSDMKDVLNLKPIIIGQMDIYGIKYDNGKFVYEQSDEALSADEGYTSKTDELLSEMNTRYSLLLEQIKIDPTIVYCTTGRTVEGFDGSKFGKTEGQEARFPELLKGTEQQLASQILNTVSDKYNSELAELKDTFNYEDIVKLAVEYANEAELDAANERACKVNEGVAWGRIVNFWDKGGCQWRHVYVANYDKATNKCTVSRTTYYCQSCSGDLNVNISAIETVMRKCAVDNHHDPLIIQYPSSSAQ